MKQQEFPIDKAEKIKMLAVAGDFLLLNVCVAAVYFLLRGVMPEAVAGMPLQTYLVLANISYMPAISLFSVVLHSRIVRPDIIVGRVAGTVVLFSAVMFTLLALLKEIPIERTYLVSFYTTFLLVLMTWRLVLRSIVKRMRRQGKNRRNVVLLGDGDTLADLQHVMEDGSFGYHIVRTFTKAEAREVLPWLEERIGSGTEPRVQEVFCSLSTGENRDVVGELIRYCENNLVRFMMVPYVYNFVKRSLQIQMFDSVPVMSMRTEPLRKPLNRMVKRTFDLVVSGLFLLLVFPWVYLIVGLAIKLSSPGPIFFKQARNGMDGAIFHCYKFRSMKVNKDSDRVQATKNDPRKTKLGNFLRKTNLDELPQFINVFKGEMSLVGPRPHMLKHTEEYSALIDKYMLRHLVKPGITGWAQVTGFRGETKELEQMEGRVRQDIWYMENWSFWLDLRIMVKTVTNMLGGEKNAY